MAKATRDKTKNDLDLARFIIEVNKLASVHQQVLVDDVWPLYSAGMSVGTVADAINSKPLPSGN